MSQFLLFLEAGIKLIGSNIKFWVKLAVHGKPVQQNYRGL